MLIDAFAQDWLDELDIRVAKVVVPNRLYVFLDGAFVPGLHKILADDCKAILFALLPGCTQQAMDASPFLMQSDPATQVMKSLLRQCNRWPMVSVIETPESLEQLARRLSAWCVVEADCQRFNFRFSDTRRLPAIFNTLNPLQRRYFIGPAVRWAYVARDGCWCELPVEPSNSDVAVDPVLDNHQFDILVDDSRTDELTVLLSDRGHEVSRHPSKSYKLLSSALRVARAEKLHDDDMFAWCEWYWKQDLLCEDSGMSDILRSWRAISSEG
jgi:hypothetical protein